MTIMATRSDYRILHQSFRPRLKHQLRENFAKRTVYYSKTAPQSRDSFSKLLAASDDADKVMTRDEVKELIEKSLLEKEKTKSSLSNVSTLSGESLNRAGLYFTVISLYLALTSQINMASEKSSDKYDKLKDLINDMGIRITNLENKITNLEGKFTSLKGEVSSLSNKIETKKGLFLHIITPLDCFPSNIVSKSAKLK